MLPNSSRSFRHPLHVLVAVAALWSFPAARSVGALVEPAVAATAVLPGAKLLTSFEQIWGLSEEEQKRWHPVRLDYLVYFYDPLWMALWGRCGEADSYLSLGTKVFPIKPGQRIRVEGLMQPARGMRVDQPSVTVLEESVPLDYLPTAGELGRTELFNKRLVSLEGYVDRQMPRDTNHLEIHLLAEGRAVLAQLVLNNDVPAPQLTGSLVRMKGVYFARNDPNWTGPRIEVWVQRNEDVEVLGSLDRDERFDAPLTRLADLADAPTSRLVHVAGRVHAQQPGSSIVLRDENAQAVIHSPQTLAVAEGDWVEAIGFPANEEGAMALRQALFRHAQKVVTSVSEVWALPEAERQKWLRARLDVVVHYHDPAWGVLWGRVAGNDDFVPLGQHMAPLRNGNRVLIEGSILPANNARIEHPKLKLLEEIVPLEPLSAQGRIGDVERFNKRWVTVEGYFDRQLRTDASHYEVDLVVDGRQVIGRLLVPEGTTLPDWTDARLAVTGVYSATTDPTGGLPTLELWVPGLEHVRVTGSLQSDERFDRRAVRIEELASADPKALVRVIGTVRAHQPGRQLTIRDETGQLLLESRQTQPVQLGDTVEAVGYPSSENARWILREVLYRKTATPLPAPASELPKLRLADQLRELQPEEAARGYPVQLSGVVTWTRPNADFFFVLDASGGVCVYSPPDASLSLVAGTRVEVTGISASGRFIPVVLASSVQAAASIELPEPRPVTLEQALTGVEEAQWVSMSGYVSAAEPAEPWSRLRLTTSAGEFHAMLAPPHERWAELVGAIVRVRGVCSAVANDRRQLTGIQVWVPTSRFVEVEEPAPEDPFAAPMRSIASLRQFSSMQALNRRARVAGVVIHQVPGRVIHIQDEAEGLLVLSRDTEPLAPGDRIEAVGFAGRENSRVVLREARYRRIAGGAEPAPQRVPGVETIDPDLDGRLVRVEGRLLDVGAHEQGVRLVLSSGHFIFEALLDLGDASAPKEWVPRSDVALSGVYTIQFDEYRRPRGVRVQLRNVADVAVLRRPPWWTTRRALTAAGILAVVVVLGFGWVLVLRRRVQRQRGVILEQVESERAARLEAALARASKLESLGVLAGGIAHDFNNLLTVVMGNLSLAKLDPRVDPETLRCLTEGERAAARAKDLTHQLLTFAKGGEPMRAPTRLPDVVREAAHFALHGSKVRCDYEIAPDLWPASVDRGQIGQVIHNIVINANQAMPQGGAIRISLRNEEVGHPRNGLAAGRYVRVAVSDTGSGIAPQNLSRIFEPYFSTKPQGTGLGLATVYSIVRRHDGHIEAASRVGEGTTFTIWVPAAEPAPAAAAPSPPTSRTAPRVLLMDDEASIRALGSTVLKRMGCEVTAVSDGAATISEFAAAKAAGRAFDLLILDLTVPGAMGGAEAMARLREMDPGVRAIVSSGYSNDPVMANFRAHGFMERVPKPYEASELAAAVQRVLGTL